MVQKKMHNYPPIKVKKLFPDAGLPVRANPNDSGLDVCAYSFDKYFSESKNVETPMAAQNLL